MSKEKGRYAIAQAATATLSTIKFLHDGLEWANSVKDTNGFAAEAVEAYEKFGALPLRQWAAIAKTAADIKKARLTALPTFIDRLSDEEWLDPEVENWRIELYQRRADR